MVCIHCGSDNTAIKMDEGKWLRQRLPFGLLRHHRCKDCGMTFSSIQVPMTSQMMRAVMDELPSGFSETLLEQPA